MAELSGSVPTTLGALVGAATFAAGFLSTRVHRQRDHAMSVAQQMDDRMDEAALDGKPIDTHLARNQLRALDDASSDRLDVVALLSVLFLTSGVAVLGWLVAQDAELVWTSQDGWVVLAFIAAAVVVLAASLLDLVGARREVSVRRSGTVLGRLERADELWRKPDKASDAITLAETAVRQSRGLFGPAWHVLGNAHLALLAGSAPGPDAWLKARSYLERASQLGPESLALSWAKAYAFERGPQPDVEAAAREYVRGCWLQHEATRPLAREDHVIDPPHVRDEKTLRSGRRSRPALEDPAALRFRPTLATTLALALADIPPLFAEAGLTAELLRRSTVTAPEDARVALEATVEWLERVRHLSGFLGTLEVSWRAQVLLGSPAAPEYKDGLLAYVRHAEADDAAATRAEAEREAARARANEEVARRLDEQLEALAERVDRAAGEPHETSTSESDEAGAIDWTAQLEELEELIARQRHEAEEGQAEQAQRDEENRRFHEELDAQLGAMERRSTGRATEQDLDEFRELYDARHDSPWPEPRPRPDEQVSPQAPPGPPGG